MIANLITKELADERSVTASLQSRGLAVIGSSGTLVALLFGLSAVATTVRHFKLPAAARPPLYPPAVLLVAAAVAGIMTNAPRSSKGTAPRRLRPLVESPYWAVRADNRVLSRYLLTAITLEIAGIASTMAAVIALIARG